MRKYGTSNDQTVSTEEEEQPQGIRREAAASAQQELTQAQRDAIIRGED